MSPEEEARIRSGLSVAAQPVTASPDLFDQVAAAYGRRRRRAGALVMAASGGVVIAVLVPTAISAHNTGTGSTPARVPPAQSAADCLRSFVPGSLPLFNNWRGPGRVDPHTTEVIACRYSADPANPMVWRLQRSTTLTGTAASSVVQGFNAASAADLRQRCPATTQEEVWFLVTGTGSTAVIEVQLNGCGFATDGHQTVQWRRPGVLGPAKYDTRGTTPGL